MAPRKACVEESAVFLPSSVNIGPLVITLIFQKGQWGSSVSKGPCHPVWHPRTPFTGCTEVGENQLLRPSDHLCSIASTHLCSWHIHTNKVCTAGWTCLGLGKLEEECHKLGIVLSYIARSPKKGKGGKRKQNPTQLGSFYLFILVLITHAYTHLPRENLKGRERRVDFSKVWF